MVDPAEVDRTVWLRVTTDEDHRRYGFNVPGCSTSHHCLPWWYCDRAEPISACHACDGAHDVHGDDNILASPSAAPIPISAGDPLDGAICGVDEDWYAVPLGDPASRIEITGAIGFAYAAAALEGDALLDAIEGDFLEVGSTIILRSDTPEWYPDLQAPEVVWVKIVTPENMTQFGPTLGYTIQVEDGDFCAPERDFYCQGERICDPETSRCVDAEE